MPKELKESILKVISNRFYIWFLTLGVVILSVIFMYRMEVESVLWVRCIGGIAVLPPAGILRIVVKTKKSREDKNADLKLKMETHKYKLEKLKIKKGIYIEPEKINQEK